MSAQALNGSLVEIIYNRAQPQSLFATSGELHLCHEVVPALAKSTSVHRTVCTALSVNEYSSIARVPESLQA